MYRTYLGPSFESLIKNSHSQCVISSLVELIQISKRNLLPRHSRACIFSYWYIPQRRSNPELYTYPARICIRMIYKINSSVRAVLNIFQTHTINSTKCVPHALSAQAMNLSTYVVWDTLKVLNIRTVPYAHHVGARLYCNLACWIGVIGLYAFPHKLVSR